MGIAEQYVDTRLQRLEEKDLLRKPNKWLAGFPQAANARRVLDIACGLGYDSFAWARAGKEVVGIDFNPDLIDNASRLAESQGLNIRFLVADATRLPFPDGYFDICYSENLFEHVSEWQKIVAEAHRVLAPGGVFFVRSTNRYCPYNPEINHMHLYPLLPDSIKRPILKWVVKNKPAWVNYSRFPAVNWFTHPGLAKSLRSIGFDTYEIFDLLDCESLSRKSRKLWFLLRLMRDHRSLRYFVYPMLHSVEVFGVKPFACSGNGHC